MFYHLGQGLCVCVRVCVCVCVRGNEHVLRNFKITKGEKYSKCQMPVCGYVCMCVSVRGRKLIHFKIKTVEHFYLSS